MHLNYDFTPIFVRISSCLVCIPGRVLAERAPAPSRSLRLWVPWSLLHWQPLPKGSRSFLGIQPPSNDCSPCSCTPLRLASRFSLLIERLCSVNTMDKNRFECTLKKQVCAILYRGGGVCRLCCHQPGFNSVPQIPTISWGRHTWKHLGLCQLWGDKLRREVQEEGSSRASKISPDATAIPARSQVKPAILPGKTAWESSAPFPGGLVTPGHGCFHV